VTKVLNVTNMYPTEESKYYGTFVKEHVDSLIAAGVAVDNFFTDGRGTKTAYASKIPGLARALREGDYDLVHAQHTYCVYQVVLAQRGSHTKVPVVFTCHEAEAFDTRTERSTDAKGLKRVNRFVRSKKLALDLADHVVAVQEKLPEAIGYKGPFNVIAPGVNMKLFRPLEQAACRKQLAWNMEEKVVFFPGSPNRSFQKGLDLFEDAMLQLAGIRVVLAGAVPHDEMPVYMGAADVVVQTSRFEAAPVAIKEAMACNRSVVSTAVGDVEQVFGDMEGHFIAEFSAGSVVEQVQKALKFGPLTRGRERLELLGLSIEEVAQKYLALYRRILSK
jgi:teichuronic acid biosynthesis glycosyltransferase TuaC